MLDIRLIREKPDFVRGCLTTRAGGDEARIDEVLRIDSERRKSETQLQHLQSERNESVIWAEKIFANTRRSVLMGEIMADSIEEVERKVTALSRMPSVERVDSILTILPPEQERKGAR